MRSANMPRMSLRNDEVSSQRAKRWGGISISVVALVVTPWADMGWARNRQADDTRHNSPGTTRYNSSERPSPELRDTLTSPSSTSGKPWQGAFSSNSTVPAGTVMGAMAGDTSASSGVT